MTGASGLRQGFISEIEQIRTVDCHSHTRLERDYYAAGGFDLFSMTSYFQRDLTATAGGDAYGGAQTDEQRWDRLKEVLAKARNVSYWRHNLVVYQRLFGLEGAELDDANWRAVNDRILSKSQDPKWYRYVTEEVCGLQTQVRNVPWFEDWEPRYFTAVLRMERALSLHTSEVRQSLESHLDVTIGSLKEAKEALRLLTESYVSRGAVGIKLAHAYDRTLHSEQVDESKASMIFSHAVQGGGVTPQAEKELQDHIIFWLAEICQEMGLVFQIHTGVQAGWGNIPESDPLLLIPLLRAFPKVRFDLFHAGYPYSRALGMLGKHYPNVWLNMAWMYIISTAASRQILSEWIDLVPGYRLLGFGSDVHFPEMVYGHLEIARSCVADVLASKVESDFLSEDEALSLARRMFRDNGAEFYAVRRPTGT